MQKNITLQNCIQLFFNFSKDKIESQNNEKYSIIEIERPNSNYLILEIYQNDNNSIKGLHLMNMKEKEMLKLGRGLEVDIRLSDISVSRLHATIIHENNHFYLTDENSKFGTLVLLDYPVPLNQIYTDCGVQIGRSVVIMRKSPLALNPLQESIILTAPLSISLPILTKQSNKEEDFIKINNSAPIIVNCIPSQNLVQLEEPDKISEAQNKESFEELSQNSQDFLECPQQVQQQATFQPIYNQLFSFDSNKFKNQPQEQIEENDQKKGLQKQFFQGHL